METANDEISLKELFYKIKDWKTYILSQKKIIFISVIAGAIIGLIYSFTEEPIYAAKLSFALEDEKASGGGLGSALGLASSFGLDLGGGSGGAFSSGNLNELFKSRLIIAKTLMNPVVLGKDTISFAEMYIQSKEWRDGWDGWDEKPKLKNIQFIPKQKNFTRVHDSIIQIMYSDILKNVLTVSQKDKKVSITTVEVKTSNELFSKYFSEALVKEISDFYIQSKSRKARMNVGILMKQRDSIRLELNQAITGVATANDNAFGFNPAFNVRKTPAMKKQVDVQANTAIFTELVKQTELAKVTLRKETPLLQIIDRPIFPLEKKKTGKLKGIVLGGFLAGFLVVLGLTIRRLFKDLV